MKKLILFCFLLIMANYLSAQPYIPTTAKMNVTQVLKASGVELLPQKYSTSYSDLDSAGRIWYDSATKAVWYHDGTVRKRLADTGYVQNLITSMTGQHQYIFKALSVNAMAIGSTSMGVTESGYGRFITTTVIYVVKAFSGTVTTPPIISVGFTPTAFTDIFPATALSSTPTVNNPRPAIPSTALSVPASSGITVRVSVAAAFSGGGDYLVDVYLQGYYETL